METWSGTIDLGDGTKLKYQQQFVENTNEPVGEALFFLGGKQFLREELPREVTPEVVAELVDSATRGS